MAWIRCCGGSVDSGKDYIYKKGSWYTAYDNPGSYKYGGATPLGFTLSSDKATAPGTNNAVIGTSNKIDVTNYNTLHIRAKGITSQGSQCGAVKVGTTKESGGFAKQTIVTTVGAYIDYTLNLADLSGEYYIFCDASSGRAFEFDEIWLS